MTIYNIIEGKEVVVAEEVSGIRHALAKAKTKPALSRLTFLLLIQALMYVGKIDNEAFSEQNCFIGLQDPSPC